MTARELHYLSIAEASRLIASKQLSPVELVAAHIERIEETDARLNSFITLLADEAAQAARDAERAIQAGNHVGPLHGIPIGLKDLFYTKGVRTTSGTKVMGDFVPDFDAAVTENFREAGAILMGKLQMHELAFGPSSENPHHGPAHNPWDPERVTGGSSGGSGSAVASGQCMGALGTDTGGSVRIPSSLCGIVGLKPTFGRVSRRGVYPLSSSLDTVGPMARSAEDVALILNAIAGYDPRDPSSANVPAEDYTTSLDRGVSGLRIGLPQEHFYDTIDAEVKEALAAAAGVLGELGATVEEVSIPVLNYSLPISGTILFAEAAEVNLEHLRDRAGDLGPDVRTRLEVGVMTPASDYIKAQRARTVFDREIGDAMRRYDVLLAPATPITAPRIGQATVQVGDQTESAPALLSRLTRPFNICGLPAASVPCGFSTTGLPMGMQLVGRAFEEATVLRAAHAYEQAADWHSRRPVL